VGGVNLYPVLELMDIYYGHRYGWLAKLLEVSDTVVLRPEAELGKAFRVGASIKRYLAEEHGVPAGELGGLKVMLDHGIFVGDFEESFGVHKSPRALVGLYSALGADYGLAYDIPSRLHLEAAVELAASKLLGTPPSSKAVRAVHPSMVRHVERAAEALLAYLEAGRPLEGGHRAVRAVRRRAHRLVRRAGSLPPLHSELHALSEASVGETIRNLEEMLRYKACCGSSFRLVPVVQGLYEEHARECLKDTIDLLVAYGETPLYIAIGTGGRVLSGEDARVVNMLLRFGHEYAGRLGLGIRFHLLGWSSPKTAEELELGLVYSSDSLSARRRAGEGRVYVLEGGGIRLVEVSRVDPSSWSCQCPVCSDSTLRSSVLDPSKRRKNDARTVHNLWAVKEYISKLGKKG